MATSAAICLWRPQGNDDIEVLLVHPGGPYWAKKHEGAWSLPKGEFDPAAEEALDAARREFEEELGTTAPHGDFVELGQTRLKSGKLIYAWAAQGDLDADNIVSNTFSIEWPPRSGKQQEFPEVDRATWCDPATATELLNPAQAVFIERLLEHLSATGR